MRQMRNCLGLLRYGSQFSPTIPRSTKALATHLKPRYRSLEQASIGIRYNGTQSLPEQIAGNDNPKTKSDWTPPATGILAKLPPSWVPYAELSRLDRPGGLYVFYMAYLTGLSYAACCSGHAVSPTMLASTAGVLLVYNVFLRGAACTANDILDCEYDRQVERCRNRPMVRGAVTPAQGWTWYVAQSVGAAATITAGLPDSALAFAYAIPIQFLVSVYPFAKRYTDFPQLILSVPIAGGALMATASVGLNPFQTEIPELAGAIAGLFMYHYFWTTIYDYVSACRDTVDDIKAGVRGMAVRYQNTALFISTLGAAQVGCLAVTGILAGFSPVFFIGAVGGNAFWLAAMAKTVNRSKPDICTWWYSWGGLIVCGTTALSLLAEYFSQASGDEKGETLLVLA